MPFTNCSAQLNHYRDGVPETRHPFLSPEWFAAVDALRAEHAADAAAIETSVRMNQVITGAPFAEGPIKTSLDTSSGQVVLQPGELADADVTITTDWETARALFVEQDQAAVMAAFMEGKVQIQGDLMKLLAMQASLPADESAQALAAQVQAITE